MFQRHRKALNLSLVTYYLFAAILLCKDIFIHRHDGRQAILVCADLLPSSSYFVYRRNSLGKSSPGLS